MKMALDWWNSNYDNFDGTAKDTIGIIQQIQLDAIKEGMNRAADISEGELRRIQAPPIFFRLCDKVNQIANQLTLKDL